MPIISPTAISPHRIGGKSWSAYCTQQYKARVETDGGFVVNEQSVREDYAKIKEINEYDSLRLGLTCDGGFFTEIENGYQGIKKCYDLSANNDDPTQTTKANQPSFYGSFGFQKDNEISFFNSSIIEKLLIHLDIDLANYTAFYVVRCGAAIAASSTLHGGNWATGDSAIMARISTMGAAPVLYKEAAPAKKRAPSTTLVRNQVLTLQPAHILINDAEVTYKVGYTDDVPMIGWSKIGGRLGGATNFFDGEIVGLFIFNKLLSDANRSTFGTYLKNKYCKTDYSDVDKLTDYEQLDYVLLDKKTDKILGWSENLLRYSEDNGLNWATTAATSVYYGYMFSSGRILFNRGTEIYKSDDKLSHVSLVDMYDLAGDSIASINGANILHSIASAIYGTDEIIAWATYGTAPNQIIYSKNGDFARVCLQVGPAETYNATHFHWVVYSESQNKWYASTGDSAGVHWFEGTYNNDTDTWSWTRLFEGNIALGQMATGAVDYGDDLYFVADMALAGSNHGVWKCPYTGMGDPANFERLYFLKYEFGFIIPETDRIIQVVYHPNNEWGYTRKWEIFVYTRSTQTIKRYYYDNVTPAYPNFGGTTLYQYHLRKYGDYYYLDYTNLANTLKFKIPD